MRNKLKVRNIPNYNKESKILYRLYKDGKCVQRTYSILMNEYGEQLKTVKEAIQSDLKFFKLNPLRNYDRCDILVNGELIKRIKFAIKEYENGNITTLLVEEELN